MIRQPKLVTDCRLMRPASRLPLLKPAPARRARLVGGRLLLWFPSFFLINREPSGKQSCAKEKEKKRLVWGKERGTQLFLWQPVLARWKRKKRGRFYFEGRSSLSFLFVLYSGACEVIKGVTGR